MLIDPSFSAPDFERSLNLMKRKWIAILLTFLLILPLVAQGINIVPINPEFMKPDNMDDLINPELKFPSLKAPTQKPKATPRVTAKPQPKTVAKTVTTLGPLFASFRGELTRGDEMFSPMDLSQDGDYFFSLVTNDQQIVGELKVTVRKGMVTARPLVTSGVTLKNGILTFFDDIASVRSIKPNRLSSVNLPFNKPINVQSRLKTDEKVLLYLNCPVSFKANTPGLSPFSFEDESYLEQVDQMILLME